MRDISIKTDAEVVKFVLRDNRFFEDLVQRYEKKLFRYVFRISGLCKETIEDLLQEIFIKVYQNLNDYDDQFSFSSWIYRIAHNTAVSHLRDGKRNMKVLSMEDEDFSKNFIDFLSSDTDLSRDIDKRTLSRIVHGALMKLPDKYREVLVLFYLEDKSYKEISDILKRSMSSVSVLMNRAKLKLKPELEFLNR
ncbi:MAG: RNA polymerase sigma factor [Candidatus Gracilibacteria bacterium]|jgi:RNA polymerase sigma-70 factor (ECF subfamily)